ncbi:ACP phosphodiesterase [Alkalilimnicola sp. S0819]|uniref:acyl carrier protein phosphodiesterase n=1 Tax=Alkalilimnicola sp. S0819 TaxID=2613922 RepID=UPI001261B723|nr:ACP phosphodiesterase [Alkalilimnicola sp. S0819]KAB7623706.1 DUF479 domain-containing protein [Alkalilimnicola sp. S0819]MPQ16835.1 DUF479 domain-containing protein [Alkalilimnicola sp. S0819]
MNYLAHLYLADDEQSLIGHLLADFVRGRVENLDYPAGVLRGIRQHRAVDSYTDSHALVLRSRRRFSPGRRRYAGIIVDVCYDHFLARHWSRFAAAPLPRFCKDSYRVLRGARPWLPEPLPGVIARMSAHDWLGGYAELENVDRALHGIAARFRRPTPLAGAIDEISAHYTALEADFLGFFPQLRQFMAGTAVTPPGS